MSKKAAPKKGDWHRADVIAELRKKGWSLSQLAKHHGYRSPTTLGNALNRHWPKGEKIIAFALGLEPSEIWPSRYLATQEPTRTPPPVELRNTRAA